MWIVSLSFVCARRYNHMQCSCSRAIHVRSSESQIFFCSLFVCFTLITLTIQITCTTQQMHCIAHMHSFILLLLMNFLLFSVRTTKKPKLFKMNYTLSLAGIECVSFEADSFFSLCQHATFSLSFIFYSISSKEQIHSFASLAIVLHSMKYSFLSVHVYAECVHFARRNCF